MNIKTGKLSEIVKELQKEFGEQNVSLVAPLKRLIAKCGVTAKTEQRGNGIAILSADGQEIGKVNTAPNAREIHATYSVHVGAIINLVYDRDDPIASDNQALKNALAENLIDLIKSAQPCDIADMIDSYDLVGREIL